ncbi:MAG: DUF2505 domain-containing protein, partial [Polyangiaceae bacterium]
NEIDCNVEKFWETFLDPKLTVRLFKEGLGFTEFRILEQTDTESTMRRRSAGTPKMNLPGPVAKVLGDRFGYTEVATFDKATKVWRWKMTPSTLPDKLRHEGSVRAEPIGDSKVRRIVEIELEAKVFGIGRLIESSVEKQIRESWEKSAAVTNEWLRAPPE